MNVVELLVQIKNSDKAIASLNELQRMMNQLNGNRISLKLNAADLDRKIADTKRNIQALTSLKNEIKLSGGSVKEVDKQIKGLKEELNDLVHQRRHIRVDASVNQEGITQLRQELHEAEKDAVSLSDAIVNIGGVIKGVGSAFTSIGGLFNQWQSLVGGNALNTITRTLTGYASIMAAQGLGNATGRFDTFRTFPRIMEVMGYSAEESAKAIEKMNQAVLGLPTSLDEITSIGKDFTMLLGDLEKGTDLAAAINNIFIAGGADSEMIRIGLKQFRDLLSKGSLRSMEWESLERTFGTALRFVGNEMGYTDEKFGEFRTTLKEGKIDVDEFINALLRTGNSGAIRELVDQMKDTLSATGTNLKTALANLGASVLGEIDTFLKDRTGAGLPGTILKLSTAIKTNLIPAMREWMTLNGDRLFAVFERFRAFNWGGLITAVADKALRFAEIVVDVMEKIGDERIIGFVSNGLTWVGAAGKLFSALGSLFGTIGGFVVMAGKTGVAEVIKSLFAVIATGIGSLSAPAILGIAAALSTLGAVIYQFNKTAKAKDIAVGALNLGNLEEDAKKAEQAMERINRTMEAKANELQQIDAKMSIGKQLVEDIKYLNSHAISDESFGDLSAKASELKSLFPAINAEIDENNGHLTESGRKAIEAAEGYLKYEESVERAKIAMEAIKELTEEEVSLEVDIAIAEEDIARMENELATVLRGRTPFTESGLNPLEYWSVNEQSKAQEKELRDQIEQRKITLDGLKQAQAEVTQETGAYNDILNEATSKAEEYASAQDAIAQAGQTSKSAIDELTQSYKELRDAAKESLDAQVLGFEKLDAIDTTKIAELGEVLENNLGIIKQYRDDMQVITDYMAEGTDKFGTGFATLVQNAASMGLEGAGIISGIANAIKSGNEEELKKVSNAYEELAKTSAETADFSGAVQAIGTGIKTAFDETIAKGSIFGEDGLTIFSAADFEKAKTDAEELAKAIQEPIMALFGASAEGGEEKKASGGGDKKSGGLSSMFGADAIEAMIAPLRNALIGDGKGGGDSLLGAFTTLGETVTKFADETIVNLTTKIEELTAAIIKLIEELKKLIMELDNAKKSSDDLADSVADLTGEMESASGAAETLTGSINAIAESATQAISAVDSLVSSLSALSGMSVDVPVNVTGGGGSSGSGFNTNVGGNTPDFNANGGLIYAATGGYPIFKPRGTDTVPAMLTPGEFVLRKAAVDKVGVPFLSMLNSLNIPRAIDTLMSSVSLPTFGGIVTYNNQRSYDNHAVVNQNIYTNNPNYAYRRASRWAHAL